MLLKLFLVFFKIGCFAFGGAYGSIPLIQENVIAQGWLDAAGFADIIAISESTPGPIMVNTATYVGYLQGGWLGAACATLGVITPSFLVILLIATVLRKALLSKPAQDALSGIKGCILGLILSTGITMLLTVLLPGGKVDVVAVILLCALLLVRFAWKKWKKTDISPIALIIISAILGAILY